jgi:hypothetical protein
MDMALLTLDKLPSPEVPITLALLFVTFTLYFLLHKGGPSLSHIPLWGEELGSYEQRKAKYALNGLSVFRDGYEKAF